MTDKNKKQFLIGLQWGVYTGIVVALFFILRQIS